MAAVAADGIADLNSKNLQFASSHKRPDFVIVVNGATGKPASNTKSRGEEGDPGNEDSDDDNDEGNVPEAGGVNGGLRSYLLLVNGLTARSCEEEEKETKKEKESRHKRCHSPVLAATRPGLPAVPRWRISRG